MAPHSPIETVNPDESPLDANGYVGVDPSYQNAANATDTPSGEAENVEVEDEDEKVEDPAPAKPAAPAPAKPATPAPAKPATPPAV